MQKKRGLYKTVIQAIIQASVIETGNARIQTTEELQNTVPHLTEKAIKERSINPTVNIGRTHKPFYNLTAPCTLSNRVKEPIEYPHGNRGHERNA
ncbi:MAG: hypothetical protein PUB07_07760 [Clostridia bacterium]|nr:hypothetical protein [Clostridia bacterium]